jgi:hypothetical protein
MLEEEKKATDEVSESSPIVGHIREKFYQSENSRLYDDYMVQKWFLDLMRNQEYLLR